MTKEKLQIVITVSLIPVLALIVVSNLKGRKPMKPGPAPSEIEVAAEVINQPETRFAPADNKSLVAQKKRAELPWGRDPFVSEIDKGEQISELKLQGLSFRQDNVGFAFINNEIVKKGDKLGEYEIMEVFKDRVLLKKGSQSFYLTFPEE